MATIAACPYVDEYLLLQFQKFPLSLSVKRREIRSADNSVALPARGGTADARPGRHI